MHVKSLVRNTASIGKERILTQVSLEHNNEINALAHAFGHGKTDTEINFEALKLIINTFLCSVDLATSVLMHLNIH